MAIALVRCSLPLLTLPGAIFVQMDRGFGPVQGDRAFCLGRPSGGFTSEGFDPDCKCMIVVERV